MTAETIVGVVVEEAVWLRQMAHTKRLQGNYVGAQALEKQLLKMRKVTLPVLGVEKDYR